ncbi:MAG TPA: glycogen synthase [Thermoanaerobaculia bacterium]|nr:glycogen synthase [Thermoanaerobaculia bacterium]
MRILMLAAEAAPLAKVGGLADVVGSLPRALQKLGHDVRVALPGYGAVDWSRWAPERLRTFPVYTTWGTVDAEVWQTDVEGIPHWLITGPPIPRERWIYGRSIEEDGPKFVFFSLAALWASEAAAWKPDVVHAHDSHTGAAVWWLGTEGRENPYFRDVASVFTIHNLPYAAQGAGKALGDYKLRRSDALLALAEGYRDSLMGIGILAADWLTTVSPTYAREILSPEGGKGLDGVLRARADRLEGILNGIDTESWDPAADPDLIANFDAGTLDKRARNKTELQREAGLEPDPRMPLLSAVSRLVKEKGFDIAVPAIRRWLERGGQFVLLGTGDPALEHEYAQLEIRYPHRASVRLRFDARYARRIYGGADAIVLPSRYEPCGLAQMIAMRYGCVPIARRTGGLADTVVDAGDPDATGLMFDGFDAWALWDALDRALKVYAQPAKWAELQRNGMGRDFSWSRSGRAYAAVYARAAAARAAG